MSREAQCPYCKVTRPSYDPTLAFFEDRGPESRPAVENCRCGYHEKAHDKAHMASLVPGRDGKPRPTVVEDGRCPGFEPHGPWEFDSFYCGCRGWD